MATERTERPLEFVSLTKVGQTVAGKVKSYNPKGEKTSGFVLLSPIFLRDTPTGDWIGFASGALNLSTDIARKFDQDRDMGTRMLFNFHAEEKTSRGGVKKLVKVWTLEDAEAAAIAGKAKMIDGAPAFPVDPDSTLPKASEEEEDLPF